MLGKRYCPVSWPALLMLLVLTTPVMAYDDPLMAHMDVAVGYDNNVGNAGFSAGRRDDAFAEAGLRINRLWLAGVFVSLELEAGLRSRQYQDYHRLSHVSPDFQGRLNYRPAGGFFMPTVTGWGGVTYLGYGSDIREGSVTRAGLSLRQPLTTHLTLWASATDARRRADNDVFSYGFHTLGLQLGWQPVSALTAFAGYSRREGDFVSTNVENADIQQAARAWLADDAFGADDDDYVAYRLNAPSERLVLGLEYALSGAWALTAQGEYIDTSAYRISYQRSILRFGLSRSFPW